MYFIYLYIIFIYIYNMKTSRSKTIITKKHKKNKTYHISIKYNDNIYIDTSNQSTIFHFLHSQNTLSTNLSQNK